MLRAEVMPGAAGLQAQRGREDAAKSDWSKIYADGCNSCDGAAAILQWSMGEDNGGGPSELTARSHSTKGARDTVSELHKPVTGVKRAGVGLCGTVRHRRGPHTGNPPEGYGRMSNGQECCNRAMAALLSCRGTVDSLRPDRSWRSPVGGSPPTLQRMGLCSKRAYYSERNKYNGTRGENGSVTQAGCHFLHLV